MVIAALWPFCFARYAGSTKRVVILHSQILLHNTAIIVRCCLNIYILAKSN